MATNEQNESPLPTGKSSKRKSTDLLPRYYRTESNKKFFNATLDQLITPGTVKKLNGYVGRQYAKSVDNDDIFLSAAETVRQNYQLEPAAVITDRFNNLNFFKDYIDHINHIDVFGGNVSNHERLNKQEFYSWDPHIDWDKFTNFQQYYWLPYGPDSVSIQGQQPTLSSDSETELTIGTGQMSLYIGTGISFTNQKIKIQYSESIYMEGTIKSYDTATGLLIADITNFKGSGTYNDWTVISYGVLSTYTVIIEDQGDSYAYLMTPDGLTRNPTLILYRGLTYIFNIDSPSNPFSIKTERIEGSDARYNIDVIGNGINTGSITFTVTESTPDILYYQSEADANIGGVISIQNIDENTIFDLNKDLIGKKNYQLANGYNLSNGMKINFTGKTIPEIYQNGYWYVEAVGTEIKLISEQDLEIIGNYTEEVSLLFDDKPFDKEPFSSLTSIPKSKDYVVINRSSIDRNPWSRSNRWFHQDVLLKTALMQNKIPTLDQSARATRPIIEFEPNIKLYNFGHQAKINVDLIDNFTTDVFSTVEGSLGYNVDGIDLAHGMRVLFTADSDRLVNGKIFKVNFIEVIVPNRSVEFLASTGVNPVTDVITFNDPHGLTTGNRVIYLNEGNLSVNGLINRQVYYVSVINEYSLKFYTNQSLTNLVDLAGTASGTHSIEVYSGLRRQINLVEEPDSVPILNECVLVKNGKQEKIQFEIDGSIYNIIGNQGQMYWYDGTVWKRGPVKNFANQSPLFDIFDENMIAYGDDTLYSGSSFKGTKIFSYKKGSGSNDSVLGFPLSYRNINNTGDILFDFNLLFDGFKFKIGNDVFVKYTDIGFLRSIKSIDSYSYKNAWTKNLSTFAQPIVRVYKNQTNNFSIDVFNDKTKLEDLDVRVFINGKRQNKNTYAVVDGVKYKQIRLENAAKLTDIVTLKCYSAQSKNSNGFYEVPISLQNNPLNASITEFTLGEVIDHVDSIIDNLNNFEGLQPGSNNLRDLGNITPYGVRFVQHTSPLNFALYHLGSKENNLFKSLEQAREDYGKFKRSFLTLATSIDIDTNIKDFVDIMLLELFKDKSKNQPYYLSDMFAYTAAKKLEFKILDSTTRIFPLRQQFNLESLSNKSVLLYLNGVQLLQGKDYTFGTDAFVTLASNLILVEDDLLEIFEYESTDGSYCPPTPTKLGLYPLYEPKIYIDDTYSSPTTVIQGHDGSLTIGFDDYRDELLLELEKRIYNNVKVKYDRSIFNIHDFIPGYSRKLVYTKDEYDNVMAPFFYQWTAYVNYDFTKPDINQFDIENSFTFNYRDNYYPDKTEAYSFWRGIYKYTLDTDRPHTHPWECLGFSIEPYWWQDVYGPAPYTKDNLVLWEDLRQGLIKEPGVSVKYLDQFARPILAAGYPVDDQGNLISPMLSNFATGYIRPTAESYFVFGDQGPVETAWRRSSYYPFALIQTALLLQPNKVIGLGIDRSRIIKNLAGQLVYKDTLLRLTLKDLLLPSTSLSDSRVLTAGLINYLVDYITNDTTDLIDQYRDNLQNLTNKISSRLGGFTSKPKFRILLDSKNPTSTGGIFVPEENYNIYLNTSSAIEKLVYSGVIITKYADGFEVRGYIRDNPYFKYYQYNQQGRTINIGGISESYLNWQPGQFYLIGQIVKSGNNYFRVKAQHTASGIFEKNNFSLLPELPITGGRNVDIRKSFDISEELIVAYGTKFKDIQGLADFLQGYGAYLEKQGFVFDEYNTNLKGIDNWKSAVKEFVFWTTQNWGVGSAISISPSAKLLTIKSDLSVIENLRDSFYGYKIFRVDGEKLDADLSNIFREENEFTLTAPNTNHGIYGGVFYKIQKEHILILDNTTLFNDVIYDLEPGYRQERVKIVGYISTNWKGGFNVPGFVYDTATIKEWISWTDYNLGDIVFHKEFYYSANKFLPGTQDFNADDWTLLREKPTSQLLANWDYRAEQFTDFYDLDSDNFDTEQQRLAQHLIGYQKRQYLENIINDDVSQYKFYQGMILEKGTFNVLTKLFDVLSSEDQESITFNEEWAVRVGKYGATNTFDEIEINLDESLFKLRPQPIEFVLSREDQDQFDFIIKQLTSEIEIKPLDFTPELFQTTLTKNYLRTPGYVRFDDVKLNIDTLDDIISYSVDGFNQGDYVWCAFEGRDWNVYRFTKTDFRVVDVEYDASAKTVSLQCDFIPTLSVGDILGIDNTNLINGFYKIAAIKRNKIIINKKVTEWEKFADSASILTYNFIQSRIDNVDNANSLMPEFLKEKELFWADNNGGGLKTVYQHDYVYSQKAILKNEITLAGANLGKKVVISQDGNTAAVADNFKVYIFIKQPNGSTWLQQDIITPLSTSTSLTAPLTAISNDIYVVNTTYFDNSGVLLIDDELIAYTSKTVTSFSGLTRGYNSTIPAAHSVQTSIFDFYSIGDFASEMAFSPDSEWLAIGSPTASNLKTGYKGLYDGGSGGNPYVAGDIVKLVHKVGTNQHLYLNTHWKAKRNIIYGGDWSTINQFSQDWEPADLIELDPNKSGNGYLNQGYVSLYQRSNRTGSYTLRHSFVSPEPLPPGLSPGELAGRPEYQEKFGSKLAMAKDGDEYILAVGSSGYNSNQGRVYLYRYGVTNEDSTANWRMDYIKNYKGSFNQTLSYTIGDLVFYQDELYECMSQPDFQNPFPNVSSAWQITSRSNILGYFPQEVVTSVVVDSHLVVPPLNDETVEMVLPGYEFGYDIAFDETGSTLIISAPSADQAVYENYKGPFRPALRYRLNDVVFYQGSYYRYNRTISNFPIGGLDLSHWDLLTSTRLLNTGKVFVYNYSSVYGYQLIQTLSSVDIDLETEDKFGESISISSSGSRIAVGSTLSDIGKPDSGRVIVYKLDNGLYDFQQKVYNYKQEAFERFGSFVNFMNDDKTLVIFSANGDVDRVTTFDNNNLSIDNRTIRFVDKQIDSGRVDIFDRLNENYIFAESLDTSEHNDYTDRYGYSIAVGNNNILVSAIQEDGSSNNELPQAGKIYCYNKINNTYSWTIKDQEDPRADISKIKKAYIYNKNTRQLIRYMDVVDPTQGRIPGPAEQEIRFKTYYDPAVYSISTLELNVDDGQAWAKSYVGMLWWDLTKAKFLEYQVGNTIYQNVNWNKLYPTASIDIYEWVESKYAPAQWDSLSGTEKGDSLGISGSSRYGNSAYVLRQKYDNIAKTFSNIYYFWVKNPTVVPNITGRTLSASYVSSLIASPMSEGYSCLALTSANSISLVNCENLITGNICNLNLEYWLVDDSYTGSNSHSQWKIISEHPNTVIPKEIETKWMDSLTGKDGQDRPVPNLDLPLKKRYGVNNRPRQSMFVNRIEALKQFIERVNGVLVKKLIVDDYDLSDLYLYDPEPSTVSGMWDMKIDSYDQIRFVGTALLRSATISPVIDNGRIVGANIIDQGYGYKNAPFVSVKGIGKQAELKTVLNSNGSVSALDIKEQGFGYTDSTKFIVRPFTVLVSNDSNSFDKWALYEWNSQRLTWIKVKSQSFNVLTYWSSKDWYSPGYNEFTKVNFIVDNTYELARIDSAIGETVKVASVGAGGWLLLEKYADVVSLDYTQSYKVVGRQNGTVQFSSSLYDYTNNIIGFDSDLFDSIFYDNLPAKELKIIIETIKNKILVDDLYVEYLILFLSSLRYVLNEQMFVDWIIKTSFVKATHNAGDLVQKVTYRNDSLENYEDYIKEVKPYRTQIREYISSYRKVDLAAEVVSDFDLPPNIDSNLNLETVSATINSQGLISSSFADIETYPWKNWYDNLGCKILSIDIVDGGSGYINTPTVKIVGGFGSGAIAKAYISQGRVNRIQIINSGSKYLRAPIITIEGGLNTTGVAARAVAIIESEVVRSNKITVKFDRITSSYFITDLQKIEQFTGTGSRSQWTLIFSPLSLQNSHAVKVDGIEVLKEKYTVKSVKSTSKGFDSYYGILTLLEAPAQGSNVEITYTKNYHHLSAADRINFYYNPGSGQKGKDLAQLMNGIDYGGVNLTGLGFNIRGGWDSQPYFSDLFDAFDENFDDYMVTVSDSTYTFTLPFTPADQEQINVYVNGVRIDDPYYDLYDGSTVQPNGRTVVPTGRIMKSIIGDGSTTTFMLPTLESNPPLDIQDGDTVIFRKASSDGSYTPLPDEYDTQLSGGDLVYTTATGLSPDDINIDGDGFVTPSTSHAPEEVVPGQILDAVAIKVYQLPNSGSSKIFFKNIICDGVTTEFNIGQIPQSATAVLVKLDNLILEQNIDYTFNWSTRSVVMNIAPIDKKILNIISFSYAGEQLLDTNYFISDGSTLEYITSSPWRDEDLGNIVLVNSEPVSYELFKTDSSYLKANQVGIRFGSAPELDSLIVYMISADNNSSASIVKSEELAVDGSTTTFALSNLVGIKGPKQNSIIVLVDGGVLDAGNSEYILMKDNELTYSLNKSKSPPLVPNPVFIEVYKNGELLTYGSQYFFDLSAVTITIDYSVYELGSIITVYNYENAPYTISSNQIIFNTAPDSNSRVEVISFYNHNVQDIVRTRETLNASGALDIDTPDYYRFRSLQGGKIKLVRPVKVDDFIWVIKNNSLLSHSIDYYLNWDNQTVILKEPVLVNDVLDIIVYGSNHVTEGFGYMQFKDMLNRVHYKRLNKNKSTRLGADLHQTDRTITVTDGSVLSSPNNEKNLPGIIEINGERIEYYTKQGNILGQIRRATLGTGAPQIHKKDTLVQDIGFTETIPYYDTQWSENFISDGSSSQVNLLNFTVLDQNEVDVFVAGKRLKKVDYSLYLEANGYPYSPEGDSNFDKEFMVIADDKINLTSTPDQNTRITVVKRNGKSWIKQDENLTFSNSPIAKFIRAVPTNYPEYPSE